MVKGQKHPWHRTDTRRTREDGKLLGNKSGHYHDPHDKLKRNGIAMLVIEQDDQNPDMSVIERENGASRLTTSVLIYEEMKEMGLLPTRDSSFFYIRDDRDDVISVFEKNRQPKRKSGWYKRLKRKRGVVGYKLDVRRPRYTKGPITRLVW